MTTPKPTNELETAWTKAQDALAKLAEQPTTTNNLAALAATTDVINIIEIQLLLTSPRTRMSHRTLPKLIPTPRQAR